MLNSLTKRFKGEQSQPQIEVKKEIEGFICPLCMTSFDSPDLVQKHFDSVHNDIDSQPEEPKSKLNVLSPSVERKESFQNIQENFIDLKQSLDEEIWFNKELEKECGRLNNVIKEKEEDIKMKNEFIERQKRLFMELENARDILTEELKKARLSRESLTAENKSIRSDLQLCEEKIFKMVESAAEMQNQIDQQKRDNTIVGEQMVGLLKDSNDLGTMIQKCETTEKLLQELRLEHEKLTNVHKQALGEMEDKCEKLNNIIKENKSENSELRNQIEISRLSNDQWQDKFDLMSNSLNESEDKMLQVKRNWEADQIKLENISIKLGESEAAKKVLEAEHKEQVDKLKGKELKILHLRNSDNDKSEKIKNIQKSNNSLIEELNSVKQMLVKEQKEKNLLQSQVQMTDAANLVVEQLQSEKLSLQENVTNLKKQLEKEYEENQIQLSNLNLSSQTQAREIFDLNHLISESKEQVKILSSKNSELLNQIEKNEKRIESEIEARNKVEEKVIKFSNDLKTKEELMNLLDGEHLELKSKFTQSLTDFKMEEEILKNQLAERIAQLEVAKNDAKATEFLKEKIELKETEITSLQNDFSVQKEAHEALVASFRNLKEENEDLEKRLKDKEEIILNFHSTIKEQETKVQSQLMEITDRDLKIDHLNQQIEKDSKLVLEMNNDLSMYKSKIVELEENIENLRKTEEILQEEIKTTENSKGKLNEDISLIKTELDILKRNLMEKEEAVSDLSKKQKSLENELSEHREKYRLLEEHSFELEKDNSHKINELLSCKIENENIENLYKNSVEIQQQQLIKLETVEQQLEDMKMTLINVEDQNKVNQLKHSNELECLRKEETQLKNHIKALTETLNESSETYKQELLNATEKGYTLKSENEDLQRNLETLTKSMLRVEEDLESEKNLRESERNNMIEKISKLSEEIMSFENLKMEYEQKMENVETENIENKLRLEVVNEEKENLLEKIIQTQNNLNKQNELYSKRCREFDQLQSAILDLGRENQSLQISKEKLTNRQWIGDVEAVDCFACRKSFSITLRKHHCRNCGQVYCQNCSSKAASLAVSRKPVRVCDACYLEIQSHRKNSNVNSSNISLQI